MNTNNVSKPYISEKAVSVIIACLFEEKNIRECLERVARTMPNAEIIIVHGGTDRTYDIAMELAADTGNIIPVQNKNDMGKGHAIQVGIGIASHDVMCQFDADLQFEPEDMPRVLEPIFAGKADIVVGSRFLPDSDNSGYSFNFFRTVGNLIVSRWISLLCGTRITDVTTGYKAWTRQAITGINFKDQKFLYEIEILVRASILDLRIAQVPVKYHNRVEGISGHGSGLKEYWSIIKTGILILWTAFRIRLTRDKVIQP